MRITGTSTPLDGVTEQSFILDQIPGVLWTPEDAAGPRPLILIGHGGGQHKKAPGVLARATRFARGGFAVAAIDAPNHGDRPRDAEFARAARDLRARMAAGEDSAAMAAARHELLNPAADDWRAVISALQGLDQVGVGPVGYWGLSLGSGLGVPLLAAEPRIRAAVLGLLGLTGLAEAAAQVTIPILFLLQWDDELVPRDQGLALFDALASAEKTLHVNPGGHGQVPAFETSDAQAFFARHLGPSGPAR